MARQQCLWMKGVVPYEDSLFCISPALVYIKMDRFCVAFSCTIL